MIHPSLKNTFCMPLPKFRYCIFIAGQVLKCQRSLNIYWGWSSQSAWGRMCDLWFQWLWHSGYVFSNAAQNTNFSPVFSQKATGDLVYSIGQGLALWPKSQIWPTTCFPITQELEWFQDFEMVRKKYFKKSKEEEYCVIGENCRTFTFQCLSIKFYCDTAMLIHLYRLGCFHTTIAKSSSCFRNCAWPLKSKRFTIWSSETLANPWYWIKPNLGANRITRFLVPPTGY